MDEEVDRPMGEDGLAKALGGGVGGARRGCGADADGGLAALGKRRE